MHIIVTDQEYHPPMQYYVLNFLELIYVSKYFKELKLDSPLTINFLITSDIVEFHLRPKIGPPTAGLPNQCD